MDDTEKQLKLRKTIDRIEKGEIDSKKLQIIYSILQNTSEYYIHNLNGATGNKVFLHKDGHKEAVYDPDGNLVQDDINDPSYNYYGRRKDPLKHYSFDTHPWIMWGASQKDPTSQQERIYGFVKGDGFPLKTLKSFQKDADIVRLKHLKYYGELLEKYYAIKGKYPFQGKDTNQIYVDIANDKQEKATKEEPIPQVTVPLSDFITEIEATLGHEIEEYYDPQYGADYKPNFYMYMVTQNVYFFAIC